MFIGLRAGLLLIYAGIKITIKHRTPVLRSVRLLAQVSERIHYFYYSLRAEKIYLHWVKFFCQRVYPLETMVFNFQYFAIFLIAIKAINTPASVSLALLFGLFLQYLAKRGQR